MVEIEKKLHGQEFKGSEVWCKTDAPVEVRVVRSVLLGLRWQLGEWGFNKKIIKVDVPAATLTVDKVDVATLDIKKDKVEMKWHDAGWKEWHELHNSEEMKKLLKDADDKLKQAAENRGKGIGKGKGVAASA